MNMALLLGILLSAALAASKKCVAVPLSKCGTDWEDNCLLCGTKSDYDCEKCCPGCTLVSQPPYKYCNCDKAPTPPPTPGHDTWDNYKVADMDVLSVTGGPAGSKYDKVVIMLHGGGGQGTDWRYNYNSGWFGDISGMKYVFPTSPLSGHVWYVSTKTPGCGLADDCAYVISSITHVGQSVATLVDHEKKLVGGDGKKVFIGGFSQGAQLTSYMQIAKLDFALGGAIVFDGFPLPPLCDMPGHSPADAKKNATYYGQDMRWMVWQGGADPIFPAKMTMEYYQGIFDVLGVNSTIKVFHTEPGQGHSLIKKGFDAMVTFIQG